MVHPDLRVQCRPNPLAVLAQRRVGAYLAAHRSVLLCKLNTICVKTCPRLKRQCGMQPTFGLSAPAPAFGATSPAFGLSQPTPAFGASPALGAPGGFGATTTTTFGAASAPAFGANPPAFGASPSFGGGNSQFASVCRHVVSQGYAVCPTAALASIAASPSAGFGGAGFGAASGTQVIPFTKTQDTDSSTSGGAKTTISFNHISAMKAYETKSPEELRWEDYQVPCRLKAQPVCISRNSSTKLASRATLAGGHPRSTGRQPASCARR